MKGLTFKRGTLLPPPPARGGDGWGIKGVEPLSTSSVSSRQLFYTVLLSGQRGGTPPRRPKGRKELEADPPVPPPVDEKLLLREEAVEGACCGRGLESQESPRYRIREPKSRMGDCPSLGSRVGLAANKELINHHQQQGAVAPDAALPANQPTRAGIFRILLPFCPCDLVIFTLETVNQIPANKPSIS